MTMGPGDQIFSKFGHNAIVVERKGSRQVKVYNFGTFSFNEPNLIGRFLEGRLHYWLSVQSYGRTLSYYERENRSMAMQELALTAKQASELASALKVNARPENKYYKYDYYRDNCSTRVRDALDRVLDGALKKAGRAKAKLTYREHSLRLTENYLPVYFALHYLMGSEVDKPITRWDEGFLPQQLRELLREVRVRGPSRKRQPLVVSEATLFTAKRDPLPKNMPNWFFWFAAVGAAIGGGMYWLAKRALSHRAARFGLSALLVVLGLFGSVWSFVSVFLWAMTDHIVAHRNENLLQLSPLCIALLALAFGVARNSGWAPRFYRVLGWTFVTASALGILIKLLPILPQNNWQIIGLCLPLWVGFWFSAQRYAGKTRKAMASKSEPRSKKAATPPGAPVADAPGASHAGEKQEPAR